jgi:hypothetical protein
MFTWRVSSSGMEAVCSSETLVTTQQTTRHHIPEYNTLHSHRCENLKSYKMSTCRRISTLLYTWSEIKFHFLSFLWRSMAMNILTWDCSTAVSSDDKINGQALTNSRQCVKYSRSIKNAMCIKHYKMELKVLQSIYIKAIPAGRVSLCACC